MAFLYRPEDFILQCCYPLKTLVPSFQNCKCRHNVTISGRNAADPFFLMVTHWPSRLGGQVASEFILVTL